LNAACRSIPLHLKLLARVLKKKNMDVVAKLEAGVQGLYSVINCYDNSKNPSKEVIVANAGLIQELGLSLTNLVGWNRLSVFEQATTMYASRF
jgi:hypothetical protein